MTAVSDPEVAHHVLSQFRRDRAVTRSDLSQTTTVPGFRLTLFFFLNWATTGGGSATWGSATLIKPCGSTELISRTARVHGCLAAVRV